MRQSPTQGFDRVVRVIAAATIVAHAISVLQTIQAISVFRSELTVSVFSAATFQSTESIISILLSVLVIFRVSWSLWAWALGVLSVGIVGLLIGLDSGILHWDKLVPLTLLVGSFIWARNYAMPWRGENLRYGFLIPCLGSMAASVALGVVSVKVAEAAFDKDRALQTEQPVPNALLEQYANILNRDLPRMVDDETRLEGVSVDGEWLVSELTLVGQTANSLSASEVEESVRQQMMPSMCAISALPDGQEPIMRIRYQVRYINGDLAAIVEISSEDCP